VPCRLIPLSAYCHLPVPALFTWPFDDFVYFRYLKLPDGSNQKASFQIFIFAIRFCWLQYEGTAVIPSSHQFFHFMRFLGVPINNKFSSTSGIHFWNFFLVFLVYLKRHYRKTDTLNSFDTTGYFEFFWYNFTFSSQKYFTYKCFRLF
jgi:hypothetical protein